jgi:hypothetical protein
VAIHQFHILLGAATILRRCGTSATNAHRISLFGLYWPGSFKSNLVLPEIPEVIFVKEPFVVAKMKVREKSLPGIG